MDQESHKVGMSKRPLETYVQRKTFPWIFKATLFTVVQKWNKPKFLSSYDCINQMCPIHNIGHYGAIKRNKLLLHARPWMNLETCVLTEAIHKGNR